MKWTKLCELIIIVNLLHEYTQGALLYIEKKIDTRIRDILSHTDTGVNDKKKNILCINNKKKRKKLIKFSTCPLRAPQWICYF